MRSNLSSAALGGEGLFNLSFHGEGILALESYVPQGELIEIELRDDVLKIDGSMARLRGRVVSSLLLNAQAKV